MPILLNGISTTAQPVLKEFPKEVCHKEDTSEREEENTEVTFKSI